MYTNSTLALQFICTSTETSHNNVASFTNKRQGKSKHSSSGKSVSSLNLLIQLTSPTYKKKKTRIQIIIRVFTFSFSSLRWRCTEERSDASASRDVWLQGAVILLFCRAHTISNTIITLEGLQLHTFLAAIYHNHFCSVLYTSRSSAPLITTTHTLSPSFCKVYRIKWFQYTQLM